MHGLTEIEGYPEESSPRSEVDIGIEPTYEGSNQPRRVKEVIQVHDFVGRMHVSVRNRNQPSWDSRTGKVDPIRIGSSRPR